ncbi:MAG: heparin lyase I family protein, partial [Deltaproteobacteria bacterium]|nr:heparin lyase I family protein [Deltaproteobacteria bacterium]
MRRQTPALLLEDPMTCSCLSSLAAAVAAALALLPAIASARVLWRGDFETGDTTQWSRSQIVSSDRMRVVASPVAQGGHAVRVLVKQGDDPINASGNRNELVYMSNETQGMERYYRWQTMFDPSYPSNRTWQVFTQFHHSGSSGSPPVEFDIYGEEIVLDVSGQAIWRAPLERGVWHDFVFHAKWSANASEGFVELYYDGRLVLPRRSAANMFSGQTNYLKQGLYRNDVITQDGIVFHDGFTIGETEADVREVGANAGPDAGPEAKDAEPESKLEPEPGPGPDAGTDA